MELFYQARTFDKKLNYKSLYQSSLFVVLTELNSCDEKISGPRSGNRSQLSSKRPECWITMSRPVEEVCPWSKNQVPWGTYVPEASISDPCRWVGLPTPEQHHLHNLRDSSLFDRREMAMFMWEAVRLVWQTCTEFVSQSFIHLSDYYWRLEIDLRAMFQASRW